VKNLWTLITALAIALAWLPMVIKFFRSWRERGNPVSLAICVLIGLAVYLPVYAVIVLPPSWPLATMVAVSGLVCACFYGALFWAKRRFQNSRRDREN
jgi:hypothetical protein